MAVKRKSSNPVRIRVTRQQREKIRGEAGKLGDESLSWGEISSRSDAVLARALNWYAISSVDSDTYEKWVINWMGKNKYNKADIRHFKKLSSVKKDTLGKLIRMQDLGTKFTGECENVIVSELESLLRSEVYDSHEVFDDDNDGAKVALKPMAEVINIQDRIKASAEPHIIAVDDEISSWFQDRKKKIDYSFYNYLQKHQPSTHVCKHIRKVVEDRLAEHEEMMGFKDEQLNEAYEYLPLSSKREILRMLKVVLDDIDRFVGNAKAAKVRKPRAKKAVSAEKQISKLNYMKEYAKLKIKSIPPETIIGATQLWVFNTKTNQIYHITGNLGVATLAVKGSSILHYDEISSIKKKVRKPEVVIKQVLDGNKNTLKKLMDSIKTKAQKFNGRIGADCVLLKAIK